MTWFLLVACFVVGFCCGVAVVCLIEQWNILKDMEKVLKHEK